MWPAAVYRKPKIHDEPLKEKEKNRNQEKRFSDSEKNRDHVSSQKQRTEIMFLLKTKNRDHVCD